MVSSLVYSALIEPIDFRDNLKWPDERLGRILLAARLGAEAENRNIRPDQIPRDLAQRWLEKMVKQEASDVANIGLEKALHLALTGSFAKAGAIFRAWTLHSARTEAALDEAVTGRRRQRANAKKPRPKKVPTAKSEVIAAMKTWRSDGSTLKDFLDASGAGSTRGVSIQPASNLRGVNKFSVECDDVAKEVPPVAYSTLEGWWKEAGEVTMG